MFAAAACPTPEPVDHFARVLEDALEISVPPLGERGDGSGGPRSVLQLRATKLADKSAIMLDNGDSLQLFRSRPWLGEGAYAKVVVGILTSPEGHGQADRAELVAVKKAKLDVARKHLRQERGLGSLDRRTRRTVVGEAVAESTLGLQAQSLAAARRLVVTDKQAYMLMPPMAASLHDVLRDLHRLAPTEGVPWNIWGIFVFNELVAKVCQSHANRVVHHDLSLKNVLLRGRSLHLADFGFAQKINTPRDNTFHGTPWCAAPEALCASTTAPSNPVANEYFALGMITLVVAGGPYYGNRLYRSLIAHTSDEAGKNMRRAYAAGWSSFYVGDPLPVAAQASHRLFAALALAFTHTHEPLRSILRSLMNPTPDRRRHGASLASGGLRISDGDLDKIFHELDAINGRSARCLIDRFAERDPDDTLPLDDGLDLDIADHSTEISDLSL